MLNFKVELPHFKNKEYNILDFGAKSDCNFNNQKAIQSAIDFCANKGGGKVVIPKGYFLTGPIELKSNVNLNLQSNAYLKFTKVKEEYPLSFVNFEGLIKIRAKSPIVAKDATNIAITGNGILDGSGDKWRGIKRFQLTDREWEKCLLKSNYVIKNEETEIWCPTKTFYEGVLKGEPDYKNPNALEIASENWDMYRPVFVSFVNCNKILIEGVTIQNSPAWNVHPIFCTNLTIRQAFIRNKDTAQNGDGIVIESCNNCEIANNIIEAGDDGITIKAGKGKEARSFDFPSKNIFIHDCKVYHAHGGFVVGSEMSRGVENVYVKDCTFCGTDVGIRVKSALGRGGYVRNIYINNVYMSDIVNEAILLTMKYIFSSVESKKEKIKNKVDLEDIPTFYNFFIDGIKCDGSSFGLKIEGIKDYPIHDINISNSYIKCGKDIKLLNCENVNLENVEFDTSKN